MWAGDGIASGEDSTLDWFIESYRMTRRSGGSPIESEITLRHTITIFFGKDPGEEIDIGVNIYLVAASTITYVPDISDEQIERAKMAILSAARQGSRMEV